MKQYQINCFLITILVSFYTILGSAITISHGPYLQNVYEREATIVWISDKPSIGWVELAPNDSTNFYAISRQKFYDTTIGIKRTSCIHSVRLTGLTSGTTYRYRVYAKEVFAHKDFGGRYGDIAATNVFTEKPLTFTTCDQNKPETSFAILNDVHECANIMEPLLNYANYKDKDMIIFNGDMINSFPNDSVIYKGFLDTAVRLFAQEKPLYYVRGNHETRGKYAEKFQEYFCPRQPHLYFTWRQGPIFFIALDTGEDKPDDDIEYYGFNNFDQYRTEEANWLEKVVQSAEYRQARFHVVIGHIPPAISPSAWHGEIEVRNKFVPILNKVGIDIMLCGHLHRFRYTPSSNSIHFPILVNSNNSCLFGEVNNDELKLQIVDIKGHEIFNKSIYVKRN